MKFLVVVTPPSIYDVAYQNFYHFKNILLILLIGYGLYFNCLFKFLTSLRKCTSFVLSLGFAKDGNPNLESLALSRTPSINTRSTPFQKYPCITLVLEVYWICFLGTKCSIKQFFKFSYKLK